MKKTIILFFFLIGCTLNPIIDNYQHKKINQFKAYVDCKIKLSDSLKIFFGHELITDDFAKIKKICQDQYPPPEQPKECQ